MKLRSLVCAALLFAGYGPSLALAQPLPTGPFASEADYFDARSSKTVPISFDSALGLVRAVELQISDQVDGGCWLNAGAVRAKIRAELERSGIAVFEEPIAFRSPTSPVLELVVLGYRMSDVGCVATASLELKYSSDETLGSLTYTGSIFSVSGITVAWSNSSIFSSGGKLDDMVMADVQKWTDLLVADIARARRSPEVQQFLEVWHKELPITVREWEAQRTQPGKTKKTGP